MNDKPLALSHAKCEWEGFATNISGKSTPCLVLVEAWKPSIGGYLERGVLLDISVLDEEGEVIEGCELRFSHAEAGKLARVLLAASKLKEFPSHH